jgi:hypothetical protein
MSRIQTVFLSEEVANKSGGLSVSRTEALTLALREVALRPNILGERLNVRLDGRKKVQRATKVGVSVRQETVDIARGLSEVSDLSMNQIYCLALEHYLYGDNSRSAVAESA